MTITITIGQILGIILLQLGVVYGYHLIEEPSGVSALGVAFVSVGVIFTGLEIRKMITWKNNDKKD